MGALATGVLPEDRVEALLGQLWTLENLADAATLVAMTVKS